MKLYYFDMPGRAEPARMMLTMAGQSFEDVRFKRDEWISTYKQQSPSGQCPFLELDDGTKIVESLAVGTYVAHITGMLPTDAVKLAKTYEILSCLEDMFQPLRPTFAIQDLEERTAARKALASPGGAMYKKMEFIEKLLSSTDTKFYLGDEPSFVDTVWFTNILSLTSGRFDGLDASLMDSFPRGAAIAAAMKEHPKLAGRYSQ